MSPPPYHHLRVLLADDHAGVREGLALLVGDQPDMEVVALAAGGRDAVRLALAHQPDVVVFDGAMRDLSGAEVAAQIRAALPQVRLLVLTRRTDAGFLQRMVRSGVCGYLLMRSTASELITAIRTVAAGKDYVDPAMADAPGGQADSLPGVAIPAQAATALSERETQVLRLLAAGKGIGEIAAQLGLGVKTAGECKASAMGRLQLRSRVDILRYATAQGWLDENMALK